MRGEGPKTATVVLVGEALGAEEERLSRPFVGPSGELLSKCLEAAGIRRSDCYLTNVIQERPRNNEIKQFFPTLKKPTDAAKHYISLLWKELSELQPNVIVPVGGVALNVLCDQTGIDKYRGRIIKTSSGVKAIPIVHPARALREWRKTYLIVADLKRIAKESLHPHINRIDRTLITNPGWIDIAHAIDLMKKSKAFAFDFEADGFKPSHISLSNDPKFSISIPFNPDDPTVLMATWEALYDLFQVSNIKVGQNLMYDLSLLAQFGIFPKGELFDTMVAHHTLYPELQKGLEFLCSLYTDEPPYKKGIDPLGLMNAKDSAYTYEIYLKFDKLLRDKPNKLKTFNFTMSLVEPVLAMTLKGIRCNTDGLANVRGDLVRKYKELIVKWDAITGGNVNPWSPGHLKDLFYNRLGAPPQYHRKTRHVTTDEGGLVKLAKKGFHTYVDILLEIRKTGKLIATYIDMATKDGRFHTSFNLAGTETGRLSSSAWFGFGGNLQTIPREGAIRDLFIADPGKVLIEVDLTQAELMVVAWLANETHIKQAIAEGRDIHSTVASIIFNVPYEDVLDKNNEQRYLAKKVVHASNYGMGPRRLQEELVKEGYNITEIEAKNLLSTYFGQFPNIRRWQESNTHTLRKTRGFGTPLGRESFFMERWGPELFRQAHAFVPQSTVGQLSMMGLLKIYQELGDEVDLLLQVHDSVLVQTDKKSVKRIAKRMKELAEIPIKIRGETLVIPSEIKVGEKWGSLKAIKL